MMDNESIVMPDNNRQEKMAPAKDETENPAPQISYLSPEDVLKLGFMKQKSVQIARDFFSHGVFHIAKKGGKTNKTYLGTERSIRIRYFVYENIERYGYSKREIGSVLNSVCGEDDEFITSRINDGKTDDEIRTELLNICRKKAPPKSRP